MGPDARSYQDAVNLKHRQAMFRLIYAALRNGTALCNGDLSFALSGCGESPREVRSRQNPTYYYHKRLGLSHVALS